MPMHELPSAAAPRRPRGAAAAATLTAGVDRGRAKGTMGGRNGIGRGDGPLPDRAPAEKGTGPLDATTTKPAMTLDNVLTTVKGRAIRARDVVTLIKIKGQFRQTIYELIEQHVIVMKAEELAVDLAEDEFRQAREQQRAMVGLSDPVKFQGWLRANGVTFEQWTDWARVNCLRELLKHKVVGDQQIEDYYARNRARHVTVSCGRIVGRSRAEAEKALRLVVGEGADFVAVARTFSIDPSTKVSGGYVGMVRRGLLSREVEERVFAAAADEVVGPFEEGGNWSIYKVYSRNEGELNDSMRKLIREQIFNEWVRQLVLTVPA